ncbi:MAG TPA: glutamine amidotransferase, partial [Lacipirellulaceae bacterium]|nr:glutamine amidotransferase [Lacipirellulaceae bacterium]
VSVQRVSASETNFESAPVTIRADVCASGIGAEPLVVALRDEAGAVVEKQTVRPDADSGAATVRFQIRPDAAGMNFYTVAAARESESAAGGSATAGAPPGGDLSGRPSPQTAPPPAGKPTAAPRGRPTQEATLANNTRLVSVDRGGGPYRILYISGRPNWEFKFLRRALADDDQLELVGLVRIAKREPKFSFRARGDRSTNQLFKGFENPEGDAAESYDEPVLVRLGTADEEELRDGFPRTAEELYKYDALVLDDLEAQFFSPDQLTLIEDFVSRRGGGLLMLGGAESFVAGDYRRTPVADVLPVYVEASELDQRGATAEDPRYRLALTRDGWLEPWVRLRKTEPEDRQRLAAMPQFQTLNEAGRLKPGATVLAQVLDDAGAAHPALVAQRYGRGRSAALLIADLWRWGLRRTGQADDDLDKSWRQTARWLVADVPQQVEVELAPEDQASAGGMTLQIRVRDAEYLPLDNAEVKVQIATPDGRTIAVDAEPSADEAGVYVASHLPRAAGAYRAEVAATAPDGTAVGSRSTGWAAQPLADEFRRLAPDRRRLEEIASRTGGEVVELDQLDQFVGTLDSRGAPITEPWTRPLWHHPLFFIVTIGCRAGEWGLRRWKGLA